MQNRQDEMNEKNLSKSNCDSNDNQLSKWISFGSPCFKPTTKPTIEPPIENKQSESKGPLQYDKKRHMYFYGVNLDELPPRPSSKPDHEVRDKDGNVRGIVFILGGKKE